jgi:hypothetical protein
MKTYPIHTDTLAKANRLAIRAARPFPEAPKSAVRDLRDTFLERLQERIAKRGNVFRAEKTWKEKCKEAMEIN